MTSLNQATATFLMVFLVSSSMGRFGGDSESHSLRICRGSLGAHNLVPGW